MRRNDEIRRLLREADPAEHRELPPADRARMRAAVIGAALRGPGRRSFVPLLAIGAALAAAAIALIALIPPGERRPVVYVAPPKSEAPAPAVRPTTARVVAKRPARVKPTHEGGVTRIVFTGPEETKILWFVGTPTRRS